MLTHYLVALSATALSLFGAAVVSLLRGRWNPAARPFAWLGLALALWSGAEVLAIGGTHALTALWLWRLSHIGVILIPALFLHFIGTSLSWQGITPQLVRYSYGMSVVWLLLNGSPWFIPQVQPKFSFRFYIEPGLLYRWFVGWWLVVTVYGLGHILRAYRHAIGARRTQLQYLYWGAAIAYVGGAPNFLPAFNIELIPWNPYGTYAIPLYALVTIYALSHRRPLELSVALLRVTLLVGACSVIIGTPLAIAIGTREPLQDWLGESWWVVPLLIGTGMLLATAWPFVYRYVHHKTEERRLSEERAYQTTLLEASTGMTRVRDVRQLLRLIVGVVTRTARLHCAALFLKDRRLPHYPLVAQRQYHQVAVGERLPNEEVVLRWFRELRTPLVVANIPAQARRLQLYGRAAEQTALQLTQLGLAVLVPSIMEGELVGFLALGPKRSDNSYSAMDLKVFTTLATQAALAIENARSFEELQQAQVQLLQAQKMGTLGQMASGMSHQIHNRLTVLSLAAQNARRNILPQLEGVLSHIVGLPAETTRLVEELRRFYQVIEEESERGSRIVRGLLEYSKPSTQHEPLTLKEVFRRAIEMLQYKHELSTIQLHQEYAPELPPIVGSRSQLQDVFFNLLDNACDAISRRRAQLEHGTSVTEAPPYQGEIRIRATTVQYANRSFLQITVADNGVGMTPQEQERLFVPFFTTKATSVKGTGLGLFVIQKIIELHGGTIRASSQPDRGTLFIAELPVNATAESTT